MTPWATFSDLTTRYPSITADKDGRATALLSDATAMIDTELDAAGISYSEPSETFRANLVATCCSMVVRAMPAFDSAGYAPITQFQQTAGVFSSNQTFANPSGDLYLTKSEKAKLGIGSGRVVQVFVDMTPSGYGE